MSGLTRCTRGGGLLMSFLWICATALPSSGQTELTEKQEAEYQRRRLSVEVKEIGMGSYGGGMIGYAAWRKWTAYRGFNPVSEQEFFRITGHNHEAQQAGSYRSRANMYFWGGLAATGLGLALVLSPLFSGGSDDEWSESEEGEGDGSSAPLIIGGLLALGGLYPMYIGVCMKQSNWAPYSTVHGMAGEYNRKLVIAVRKKF
jgi:hypothetical protein